MNKRTFSVTLAILLWLVISPQHLHAQTIQPSQPPESKAAAEWKQTDEAWYVIEIDGQRTGWANELVYDNGAQYRTESEQFMAIRRGENDVVEIRMMFSYIETHGGAPVRITMKSKMASAPEERTWEFQEGGIDETITRGGRTTNRTLPVFEGVWFMPQAAGRFESARRAAGAARIEYRSIDASGGLNIAQFVETPEGSDTFQYNGRSIPVSVWKVSVTVEGSGVTQNRTFMISEDDELVATREQLGAFTLSTRRTSRAEARRAITRAPEILVSAFVQLDKRIQGAHRTTSATYCVVLTGDEEFEFPSTGAQRVEVTSDGSAAILRIDLHNPVNATEEDLSNEALLAPSTLIESDDESILNFAARAVKKAGDDPRSKAEALHLATYKHIRNKNLGTAFASARETLRSRSGDCSEHAVLLCAVLRAEGIPARIATGLVYVDSFAGQRNVFGWHMWAQALIDGRWIDLDATLSRPFSAAHILTGVSDLADGALNAEFARLATLMGRLKIEVVEVGYGQLSGE